MNYPREIIAAYASGAITKDQFKNQFAAWQKAHGMNYDCKGTADRRGVHITYRGVMATIRDGVLCFITGSYTDADGNRRHIRERAKTPFEFRRKVDFAMSKRGATWN